MVALSLPLPPQSTEVVRPWLLEDWVNRGGMEDTYDGSQTVGWAINWDGIIKGGIRHVLMLATGRQESYKIGVFWEAGKGVKALCTL